MDGWIDDWARARAQVPKAQGPRARCGAPGPWPRARNGAPGPCALGTWARARAQSSIHPPIHLYIYEPMGHVRNHRIYFLIWGWGDKECRIWHIRKLLFITRNLWGRYTPTCERPHFGEVLEIVQGAPLPFPFG